MRTKAKQTAEFILQTTAPIFNKNGYAGTSLADITKATGLTKGAIYGNFKNKEDLAIAAFTMTVKKMLQRITNHQSNSNSPLAKLFLISNFFRNYYNFSSELGGCPILNMGVDAKHQNSSLFIYVQFTINKIQTNLALLIDQAKNANEIRTDINSLEFAKKMYTMISGAIFMSHTMEDNNYIIQTMDQINTMIRQELTL